MSKITIYDDRPDEFWVLMGPIFSSQKIRRELQYIHDEPEYVWFVATDDQGLSGFGCVAPKGLEAELRHLWVRKDLRGNGLARELAETRIKYLKATGVKRAKVTANGASRPLWESLGFETLKQRGQYSVMGANL